MAVARTGSLSAAAREMRVDHATVSRRVASLEEALGLKLIDRLPRRALLTNDGRAIAALAGGIEEITQLIERHARGSTTTPAATIRISASPAVAVRLIAPGVAAFHATNPGITLNLAGASGLAALDRGEADLAVRLARPDEADLVASRIGIMRFGLYATPEQAALPPAKWRFIAYDETLDHVTQQAWLKSLLAGRAPSCSAQATCSVSRKPRAPVLARWYCLASWAMPTERSYHSRFRSRRRPVTSGLRLIPTSNAPQQSG